MEATRLRPSLLRRLSAWCYRHRRRVVVGWLIGLVGISVLGQSVGGDLLKTFSLPGTESQRSFDVLRRDFGRKGDTGDLVFKVRGAGDVRIRARPSAPEDHVRISASPPRSPRANALAATAGKS